MQKQKKIMLKELLEVDELRQYLVNLLKKYIVTDVSQNTIFNDNCYIFDKVRSNLMTLEECPYDFLAQNEWEKYRAWHKLNTVPLSIRINYHMNYIDTSVKNFIDDYKEEIVNYYVKKELEKIIDVMDNKHFCKVEEIANYLLCFHPFFMNVKIYETLDLKSKLEEAICLSDTLNLAKEALQ